MYFDILISLIRGFFYSIKIILHGGKTGKLLRVGRNCRINIRKGSQIYLDDYVILGDGVKLSVLNGGKIRIGSNSRIGDYSQLVSHNEITIDSGCNVGPHVYMFDHDHKYDTNGVKRNEYIIGTIQIGQNSWIGVNTVILRNTTIGQNCVIGAGSLVKGIIEDSTRYIQTRVENKKRV